MADIKTGEPFGLDPAVLERINWGLALQRIHQDLRSDFIYSPHLSFLYRKAGGELIAMLASELKSGTFSPGIPLTIEVPKPFRIRVATGSARLGPNYSRPGSVLLPRDRLFYQALADEAAPIIRTRTDSKRSFSHLLASTDSANMFLPTRKCWNKLQTALATHSKPSSVRYILRIDVANFFGSLNQHTLINVLNDSGYEKALSSRLEAVLTSYTGERSSRGILQGMYPSDLFGNYYLAPIDGFLSDYGLPSARYVDDIYLFVKSVDDADALLRELIPLLRSYDLVLNEAKSVIMPKSLLMAEEPDLEALFADAVAEMSKQVDDEEFNADYGFQSEWDDDEDEDKGANKEELELQATKSLFNSLPNYPGQEENIERFCLPLFTAAASDYAVTHVMESFKKRPAMGQLYASYLAHFIDQEPVEAFFVGLLSENALVDWQRMWVMAALYQADEGSDQAVKSALSLLKDANRHDGLRAVAAIYVGSFGNHTRRKALVSAYSSVSNYVQAAIYYASGHWPGVERSNARASWSGHGQLHKLLTSAMNKK